MAKTKSTNGTAPGQPPRTRIPLRYSLPADVQNLSFTVGETLPAGISYCLPAVNVDFGQCGGSSTKDQVQPYGGVKVDGPYHFTLTLESTLPAGLLLHSNGALTGTVSSEDDAKTYPFTICVSEVGVAPSQGNTDTVCRATKVVITPATIEADPIVGTWTNTSNGHVVVIEASGSGFVGIDETTYLSGPCTFSAGEQVWQINAQGSDVYLFRRRSGSYLHRRRRRFDVHSYSISDHVDSYRTGQWRIPVNGGLLHSWNEYDRYTTSERLNLVFPYSNLDLLMNGQRV